MRVFDLRSRVGGPTRSPVGLTNLTLLQRDPEVVLGFALYPGLSKTATWLALSEVNG